MRDPVLDFIVAFAQPLKKISPHFLADPRANGGSLFRIYRDTRFSKDKTPYKTNVGAHFRHAAGKDAHAPGFYLHLEPGTCFAGCGIWHPDNNTLGRIPIAAIAAIAVVADIPYKSRRLPGVDRFLRGPHGHVPPPVRVHRAPPRAPPDRAFRCNGEPDDGVGRTVDPRGIPVGHGAAVPDPRPGRRIRAIVPLDRDGDGRGRGRYGATEPVAKSVCGTPDRQREARMPGPFDHPQRAAFAAHSWLIPRLLSRFKDPLVARQGHTGWTTRSAGRVWNGRFLAQGRRSASSLRTPRGLTTPARIRSIPLCGNVYAAGIRMPLHRFAGTIRRNKHRDDCAHGRLQNPLAQNDVRAGEPSRRWEARWNKWKGQAKCAKLS